jgi:molybdopterin-guanine dinucleotide biosynthesis protein B
MPGRRRSIPMGNDGTKPQMLSICGVKNSGKTTYLEKLVKILAEEGFKVAVIKHDGHEFQGDVPGTDSFRMYQAGAFGTAVFSKGQLLVHKRQTTDLSELAEAFGDCDLILVEGMKEEPIAKLEIVRKGISQVPVSNPKGRLGIITDVAKDGEAFQRETGYVLSRGEQLYPLEDIAPVVKWIVNRVQKRW